MHELGVLATVAPGARAALARAWDAAYAEADPALLDLARRRIEDQLGLAEDTGGAPEDEFGRAVAALVDQFVFYVPDVTEAHRAPIRDRLGADGLRTLVEAIYVLDQTTRLRVAHGRLFPPVQDPGHETGTLPSLHTSLSDLHAEAMLLDGLDPVLTEIVRLRAGNYHDCKT